MWSAELSMLDFYDQLLRASNQFASVSQINIASETSSLPSNHSDNHLR